MVSLLWTVRAENERENRRTATMPKFGNCGIPSQRENKENAFLVFLQALGKGIGTINSLYSSSVDSGGPINESTRHTTCFTVQQGKISVFLLKFCFIPKVSALLAKGYFPDIQSTKNPTKVKTTVSFETYLGCAIEWNGMSIFFPTSSFLFSTMPQGVMPMETTRPPEDI